MAGAERGVRRGCVRALALATMRLKFKAHSDDYNGGVWTGALTRLQIAGEDVKPPGFEAVSRAGTM